MSKKRAGQPSALRETDLFTEEEKLILAITEEVTLIHDKGLTSETYKKAAQVFDKKYIADVYKHEKFKKPKKH